MNSRPLTQSNHAVILIDGTVLFYVCFTYIIGIWGNSPVLISWYIWRNGRRALMDKLTMWKERGPWSHLCVSVSLISFHWCACLHTHPTCSHHFNDGKLRPMSAVSVIADCLCGIVSYTYVLQFEENSSGDPLGVSASHSMTQSQLRHI